jgi:hypothetical protein
MPAEYQTQNVESRRNLLAGTAVLSAMKVEVRSQICIASIGLALALLMIAPARQAHAQSNSAVAPSSSGSASKAPSGDEASKPAETGNETAHHKAAHFQPKKKKTSFVHKMRDKAMAKMQKFFGKREEPQSSAKQVPKQDVE